MVQVRDQVILFGGDSREDLRPFPPILRLQEVILRCVGSHDWLHRVSGRSQPCTSNSRCSLVCAPFACRILIRVYSLPLITDFSLSSNCFKHRLCPKLTMTTKLQKPIGRGNAFQGTEGIYLLPHHPNELERVKLCHGLMLSDTGNVLIKSPLPAAGSTIRILDSGCADGVFPSDTVDGR